MPRSTVFNTIAISALALAFSLATTFSAASGQEVTAAAGKVEFRVASGALVTTGEQSAQLRNAELTAAQLSWMVKPHVALVGNFSWARSRDVATTDRPKLDVFTSDIGAELRSGDWASSSRVSLSGFAGMGAGMRSYNYRHLDLPATNNVAGYLAIGGEAGVGKVALRLEARDYVTGFKPLIGSGNSSTRNDIVLAGSLRFLKKSR